MAGILAGDSEAFEAFYHSTCPRLTRVAARFLGRDQAVQDVVQEAYARALPRLKDFRFKSSLNTWLTRFVINLSLQTLAQRRRVQVTELGDLENLLRPRSGCLSLALRRMLREELANLDSLSMRIFQAKDIDGESFAEVAGKLRLPAGTVMSKLTRARLKLRRALRRRNEALPLLWREI